MDVIDQNNFAKIYQDFKSKVRTYWGSDIVHQIETSCWKDKQKGKSIKQSASNIAYENQIQEKEEK